MELCFKKKELKLEYYKAFKARQSTKMIWESFEQHCNNEFNKLVADIIVCYMEFTRGGENYKLSNPILDYRNSSNIINI